MTGPAARRLARRTFALALAGAAATVTLHGLPASASSLALDGVPHIMQTAHQAHAGTAAPSSAVPLTYQTANGPVESPPVVYLVFWGAQWQVGWTDVSNSGTTYSSNQTMSYLTGFFNYISSTATSWAGSQTQYCSGVAVGTVNCGSAGTHVGNPPTFGGTWVDTTSTPPPPVVPTTAPSPYA